MQNCIFCKIVSGDAPSHTVYADEHTVGFMDIFPGARGHLLVIPREHAATIFDLSADAAAAVMRAARRIAPALKEATEAEGMNLFQANGAVAGQTVDHFHVHLIPRWSGDGLRSLWSPEKADEAELARLATDISERLR